MLLFTYRTRGNLVDIGPVRMETTESHFIAPVAGAVVLVGGIVLFVLGTRQDMMKQTIHKTDRELTSQMTPCGCRSIGFRGGIMPESEGYRTVGSTFTTEIQRGEFQSVAMLETGTCPEHSAKLPMRTSESISVAPTRMRAAAGEADVQLRMAAADGTALGVYRTSVEATSERRCAMARPTK